MSKELESIMRFKNQTSLKRLTAKKRYPLETKPSLIAILLFLIALMQVPIALKASLNIFCLISDTSNTDQTFIFCND